MAWPMLRVFYYLLAPREYPLYNPRESFPAKSFSEGLHQVPCFCSFVMPYSLADGFPPSLRLCPSLMATVGASPMELIQL